MTKNNLKIVKTDDKKQKELKEKSKSLEAAISQIDQNFGKGSVMRLGQQQALDVEAISTGSLSLDLALGIGGLPKGRIIEIYGPESSGKTTLALQVVAEAQKAGGMTLRQEITLQQGIPTATAKKIVKFLLGFFCQPILTLSTIADIRRPSKSHYQESLDLAANWLLKSQNQQRSPGY